VSILDSVKIAKPCPVSWDSMAKVNDTTRFCSQCQCRVYDIKSLTWEEADKLLDPWRPGAIKLRPVGATAPCIQVFRRPDGTVKTKDCGPSSERKAGLPDFFDTFGMRGRVVMVDKKPEETAEERLRRQAQEDLDAEKERRRR
jgi:hypothetical protein